MGISFLSLFVVGLSAQWIVGDPAGPTQVDGAPPSKIAVVGAGIGGSATAHFLRQHFGPEVQVDVFEKGEVGGRLATVSVNHHDYESGGSIIHSLNLHMQEFVKQLGLKYRRSMAGKTAVFNGEELILEETDWYLLDLFRLWWRYGISFIRLQMWVEEIMEKFMRIYKYQAHGYAFSSVEELLESLGGSGFVNMTRRSLSDSLLELGVSQRFIDEIIAPIMRVNYGQNVSIPAFVGQMCVWGKTSDNLRSGGLMNEDDDQDTGNRTSYELHLLAGADVGQEREEGRKGRREEGVENRRKGAVSLAGAQNNLWAVEGGNKLVCSGLLKIANANLLQAKVLSISLLHTGEAPQYQLSYTTATGTGSELYDIVVLATPLEEGVGSGVQFQDFSTPFDQLPGNYHGTVATIVHGYLNTSFFGFPDPRLFPFTCILTTEEPSLFFNSVANVCPVNISAGFRRKQPQEAGVYKVFSLQPLDKAQLKTLFRSYYSVQVTEWQAYPSYSSQRKLPPVELHPNLYYLNGIESVASAMEMSSVAAKNIALLAYHRWNRQTDMVDQRDLMHRIKTEL